MAEKNVIRQDIIQIGWEVEESPFAKIKKDTQKFQSSVGKAVDNSVNNLGKLTKSAQKTQKQLGKLKLADRLQSDIELADKALARVESTVNDVKSKFTALKTQATQAVGAVRNLGNQSLAKLNNSVRSVSTAIKNVVPNMKAFVTSIKNAARQKLTNTANELRRIKTVLTQGNTGAKGFVTALKSIGKVGLAKTIKGITNIKNGVNNAKRAVGNFKTSLKTGIVNGFTRCTAGAKKFLASAKLINKEKFAQFMTGLNNLTRKLGTTLVNAAKKAARAIAAIGVGSAVGMFKLSGMASDLSETMNKVEVSFGKDNLSAMETWSKTSIKNMGMAQQTALDMAAGYGDMGTSMGLTQNSSMKMSKELVQRAADLSSFKNMELDEVNTALNGIFTGETESLKRLGVVMTQTNLEKFAADQGKVFDELSESEKVMLRYEYVMKKTSNAQGDFARTGGGFANQLRMAKEQLKQIGTTIGGVFIGGFEKVLAKVNNFGTKLNDKLSEVFKDGFQFEDIAKITPMLGPVGTAIQKIADKIRSITSNKEKMAQIKSVFEAIKKAAGKVAEFVGKCASKITDFVTSAGFLKVVKGVANALSKAFGFLSDNLDIILEIAIPLVAGFAAMVGTIKLITGAMKVWSAVQWVLNSGLLACPITWIVLGIGALIAIIVVLVRHWDKVKAAAVKCWDKIKSVWGSVKGWFKSKVVEPVKKFFADMWDKLPSPVKKVVGKIVDGFKWAYDKVTSAWGGIKNFFKDLWVGAVKLVAKPVNKLIDGANWVMEKFGSDKTFGHWEPYARGTNGHPGGNAVVNDGRGAELVQMPNGNTFIPKGRNVFLPNAPKGMKVLNAERTAQLMGRSSPSFNYAGGIGDWDIWGFFDDAKGLVGKMIDKFVNYGGVAGFALDAGKAMISTAKTAVVDWVKGLFSKSSKSLGSYEPSKGVEQWRSTVVQALKMEGLHSADNVKRTLYQMQTESGGNPKAINNWDVNARRGTPSKGLMQVIDPTFKAYARKGFGKNIYDPLSNILASIRYATARYGTLAKAYRGVGYAGGIGRLQLPVYSPATTLGSTTTSSTNNNNYNPSFTLNMSGTVDRTTERTIKKWVKEALDEAFDSMSRTSPRLTEV